MPIINSDLKMIQVIKEDSVSRFMDCEEAANPQLKNKFEEFEWALSEYPIANAIKLSDGDYEIECHYFSNIGQQKTAVFTYRFNEEKITLTKVYCRANLKGI